MTIARTPVAAAAALLALGLTACGGGSSHAIPTLTGHDKAAAASLSQAFQTGGMTAAQGHCVASRWVGTVGAAKLASAGVLTSSYAANQENSKLPTIAIVSPYADAYFKCVNYGKLEAVKFDKIRPNVINDHLFAACANKINQADAKQALIDDLLQKASKVSTKVQHELLVCAGE